MTYRKHFSWTTGLRVCLFCLVTLLMTVSCDGKKSSKNNANNANNANNVNNANNINNTNNHNNGNNQNVDPDCTSVRLTYYAAAPGGWCEFDRTLPVLPAFVRQGMTLAVAQPWNGSSFGGEPGESCGECWELDTVGGTRTVMVHDLCPIQGNPLCAGEHFHFDVSSETAQALGLGGLDEGRARRVPCPVEGNIHVQILDWNQWGYVRLQFVNHRIPVRHAALRFSSMPEGQWHELERSSGAWHATGAPNPGAGDGIFFRITSAQEEIIESTLPVTLLDSSSNHFDIGVQLTNQDPDPQGQCRFTPPPDVYVDGWGGIPGVRWMVNPWGATTVDEVQSGCRDDSAACLRMPDMARWSGMHVYYRQLFPHSLFSSFSFWARSEGDDLTFLVSFSGDGSSCDETSVNVTGEWTRHTIDLSEVCAAVPFINTLTWQNTTAQIPFLFDDLVFE